MAKPMPDDPVLRAHLRRQKDWATDAPVLMEGPTSRERKREALLAALDRRDNEARKPATRKRVRRNPASKAAPRAKAPAKRTTKTTTAKD